MNEVRMGFIGTGPRGQGLVRTCLPMRRVKVTALCDKYEALLGKAFEVAGDPSIKCYTDHRRMLREAPIDAVYVAVEPENCPSLVVESLEAGKHVLSEVPMAFTLEDIWRIVLAVENSGGLKYMLGEGVRYRPFIEKWKQLVESGALGKVVYVEGQYLHGMTKDRYFMDPVTGARLTIDDAMRHANPRKSRSWAMRHPILYLPHELSPLLRILDDRVTSVVCMGTRPGSYVHDFFPNPDLECALMHTAKDTVLRLTCCFTIHQIRKKITSRHWYSLMGTKGSVETHRSDHDKMKLLLVGDDGNETPEEVWYDYDPAAVPPEARESGHEGADYWPVRYFVDAVLRDAVPELDVYKAAETAAPAILAGRSAELDGARLEAPDFRPGPGRRPGQMPREA